MARKKRRFEQLEAAASTPQDKRVYTNPLQKQASERLDEVGKALEGKGKSILYGVGAVVVLIIIATLFVNWSRRSNGAAQTALGKAIETSTAKISETGTPAGSTDKTYKTEKERAEAAIAEFQTVVDKFGGSVGEKAKYFIAVNKLDVDRAAAVQELEGLASLSSDVGTLAKFALAQTRVDDSKLDEAVTLFQELAAMDNAIIAKDTLNFEIAKIYEKQGKKTEAAEIYFNIAKSASEAKDRDGKALRLTETATDAKAKIKELDPERAKQIVEPAPDSPVGGTR
ncbi:MAG: hypothetical protein ABIO36_04185 [Pyrinomonadaceae bacterium]